jgi:hypothetical protein
MKSYVTILMTPTEVQNLLDVLKMAHGMAGMFGCTPESEDTQTSIQFFLDLIRGYQEEKK